MSAPAMIATVLTVLALLLISVWYVPARLRRLLGLRRRWPLHTAVILVVAAYPVAHALGRVAPSAATAWLDCAAGLLFGFHLYLAMLLLLLDGVRLVVRPPEKASAWTAMVLAVAIVGLGAWRADELRVNRTEIPLRGLQQDVTLVHISDAHLGPLRGKAWLERIVREANRLEPQLILLNGDLVDSNIALEGGLLAPLRDLKAPVFFTTGNHESYVNTAHALGILARHGVRILHNERVDTHGLQLIGLDYMNADDKVLDMHSVNRLTVQEEIRKIPIAPDRPAVLLHHSPVGLRHVSQAGISLMLSGHTHAGQVFPNTLLIHLLFPLSKGLYVRDGTRVFVSQGAGTFGPRLRLGSSNEIDFIRLVALR